MNIKLLGDLLKTGIAMSLVMMAEFANARICPDWEPDCSGGGVVAVSEPSTLWMFVVASVVVVIAKSIKSKRK